MTAHCKVSTDIPVSSLMAGSRMLTAEVLALTTRVDKQVAANTPLVRVFVSEVIWDLRRDTRSCKPDQWVSAWCDSSTQLLIGGTWVTSEPTTRLRPPTVTRRVRMRCRPIAISPARGRRLAITEADSVKCLET